MSDQPQRVSINKGYVHNKDYVPAANWYTDSSLSDEANANRYQKYPDSYKLDLEGSGLVKNSLVDVVKALHG